MTGKTLALAIHDRQLSEHGGSVGVRDATLLESALARSQQLFAYDDPAPGLAELAPSWVFDLARVHIQSSIQNDIQGPCAACKTKRLFKNL